MQRNLVPITLAGVCYGFWTLAMNRCAQTGTYPFIAAGIMGLVSGVLAFGVAGIQHSRGIPTPLSPPGTWWAVAGGLFLIGDGFFVKGSQGVSLAQSGTLILIVTLVATLLIDFIVDHHTLSLQQWIGVGFAVIAVVLLKPH